MAATLPTRAAREGYQWLAVIRWNRREVVGPKSYTRYLFDPWAEVEERDVQGFRELIVSVGCDCNGTAQRVNAFATVQEIQSGQTVPDWSK